MELVKKQERKNLNMIFLSLLFAICQFNSGLQATGKYNKILSEYPILIVTLLVSIFILGPLILRTGFSMVDFAIKRQIEIIHFTPAVIVFLLGILFLFLPDQVQMKMIEDSFHFERMNMINILIAISGIHFVSYVTYLLIFDIKTYREYSIPHSRLVYTIVMFSLLAAVFIIISDYSNQLVFFHIGANLITIIFIMIFLFSTRYPDFFKSLKSEIRYQKYQKSLAESMDLDLARQRLQELMEERKLYLNENLKLHQLADELLITPHKLSRLLNEYYEMNFNDFLNDYRINEAKKMLVNELEKNILHIAYEVGFSTKATFNSQFLKKTKLTPTKYRKKYKKR
jgi:AraC-like DNA-binding protein